MASAGLGAFEDQRGDNVASRQALRPKALDMRPQRLLAGRPGVRGIEDDRAEIDVAPLSLRAGTLVASVAPITVARLQRRLGSVGVADSIVKGQRPGG